MCSNRSYNAEGVPIPPTIMISAITFSIMVPFSSGSFSSLIFWMLNKLLTKNTKNGLVEAKAATKDIVPISVALVSEIDPNGAIKNPRSV